MRIMVPILALLLQTVAVPMQGASDDRPVRLWLGATPVASGEAIPVYVAAATEGYLLVLRAKTDGHVDIVFPADPKSAGAVRPGAYELRGTNNRPALVTSEPNGTGLVLAALSPRPFRFQEFLRAGAWSRDALIASWPGADGIGTLTDIVQRMLGDGWFTYDLAIYTVGPHRPRPSVPPPVAIAAAPLAPGIAQCSGCTIVYQTVAPEPVMEQTVEQQTIVEPVVIATTLCDPFVGPCHRRHREPERPRFKTEGICQIGIDCPPGTGAPAKEVFVPQRASLRMSPIGRPTPPPLQPPPAVTRVSSPVYRLSGPSAPDSPGLAPGVRTAKAPPVAPAAAAPVAMRRTGNAFGMRSAASRSTQPAPAPAAAARTTRTIALPRAVFRRP